LEFEWPRRFESRYFSCDDKGKALLDCKLAESAEEESRLSARKTIVSFIWVSSSNAMEGYNNDYVQLVTVDAPREKDLIQLRAIRRERRPDSFHCF